MPQSQKSEQASHQKCALHRVMGRCTAQLQEWIVLLNSLCKIRILDETSQQGESATRCLKHTFQELLLCMSSIRTVSIIRYLLQIYRPISRRHTWNIPMCGWCRGARVNRRTSRPSPLGNCSKGTISWSQVQPWQMLDKDTSDWVFRKSDIATRCHPLPTEYERHHQHDLTSRQTGTRAFWEQSHSCLHSSPTSQRRHI